MDVAVHPLDSTAFVPRTGALEDRPIHVHRDDTRNACIEQLRGQQAVAAADVEHR
jgi:hypothetical protein